MPTFPTAGILLHGERVGGRGSQKNGEFVQDGRGEGARVTLAGVPGSVCPLRALRVCGCVPQQSVCMLQHFTKQAPKTRVLLLLFAVNECLTELCWQQC